MLVADTRARSFDWESWGFGRELDLGGEFNLATEKHLGSWTPPND